MATYDEYTGGGEGFTIEDLFKLYLTDKDFTKQELEIQAPLLHEGLPIPEEMGVGSKEYLQKMSPYLFRHFMDKGTLPGLGGFSTVPYLDIINKDLDKIFRKDPDRKDKHYGDIKGSEWSKRRQLGVDKDTLKSLSKELGYQVSPSDALLMSGGLVGERGRGPTKEQMIAAREEYTLKPGIERVREGQLKKADEYYQTLADEAMKKSKKKTQTNINKDKKYVYPNRGIKMGGEEQRDWASRIRKSTDPEDYRQEKFKPKKEEPFVKKEKFLERIMDKRVAPGEELSNAAKTRLYLKEISKNLLERRKKGGLEGTDTLSRIFGGITEGEEAVTAKEEDILTRREAAIDKKFERDKTVADITKIYAEAQKARLETYKQDYTKEYNKAAEMAELDGHKPGTPGYNAYILQKMERMETLTMGEGAAGIYAKIAELQAQVQFTPEGPERDQLLANIANLTAIVGGLGTGNLPENNEMQSQEDLMKKD